MAADDRDLQFERALARHLSRASGDSACPDAEMLAAYHERSLSVEEMAKWKEHIAACARCQEVLALVEQSEKVPATEQQDQRELERVEQPAAAAVMAQRAESTRQAFESFAKAVPADRSAPVPRMRPRASWSWIIPLGAIAAGAIVLVGVQEIRTQRAKETQVALERLPTPLPAVQSSAKEELKKEGVPTARTQIGAGTQKPVVSGPNVSAPQSSSLATPLPRKEVGSARESSAAGKNGVIAELEPSTSGSSYAADAETLQNSAPSSPKPAPPAAAPSVSAQQSDENKKAQVSKARIAEQLQAPAAAPSVRSAEVLARPNDYLAEKALINQRYVVAPGEKHAWRLGEDGRIEISTDHGKTWKLQSSGVSADLTAGSASSEEVCWVVGKAGTLLLTVDGGKHWNKIASPIASDLGGVHATDASHASIWDISNRTSFETNDGGVTWQRTANE
jgi:Photosynthesis system II assembly factor YCF48